MAASSRAEGAKRTAGLLSGLAKGRGPVSRRYPAYDVGQRDCADKGDRFLASLGMTTEAQERRGAARVGVACDVDACRNGTVIKKRRSFARNTLLSLDGQDYYSVEPPLLPSEPGKPDLLGIWTALLPSLEVLYGNPS